MIFLKRSCLRAIVSKRQSGQITVWLSLSLLVFLSLYLACLQSVQKQSRRRYAEQRVEIGMFSLFSEFEPHLLDRYDLFYLDTSFRSGREQEDELCGHLWKFIENDGGTKLQGINIKNLIRATDGEGAVFYNQAVRIMKERNGVSLAEEWFLRDGIWDEMEENSRRFSEDCVLYGGSVEDYEDEEDEVESEAYSWDGLTESFTISMAVPGEAVLSDRGINLETVPSHRMLSVGSGSARGDENNVLQKQWFLSYLCQYMKNAQEMLGQQREEGYLDYQLEYVLCGKASDAENLKTAVERLLLMREGINYIFLLTHPGLSSKAELLADVLVGLTGNEAIIKAMKHLILLGWAYGESLVEVRQLLAGNELAVVKSEDDWQVPLSGLLSLVRNPGRYDEQVRPQQGISYESCLRGFLSLQPAEVLAMRSLDIVEGELRRMEGCESIHLDHCVERLTAQAWFEEAYLERTYAYE